jgi:hypothetical protein
MKQLLCALFFAGALFAANAEKEVLANMEAFREAMIHNNAAMLGKLLSDDLSYVHSGGQFESKADVLKAVTTGKNVITKLEFSEVSTRIYDGTALVRCRVDLWHSDTNIVHMNVLHTWVKRPQGWQLVARQATRLAK